MLVIDSRWSPDAFERWLADTLLEWLVKPRGIPAGPPRTIRQIIPPAGNSRINHCCRKRKLVRHSEIFFLPEGTNFAVFGVSYRH